MSENVLHIGLCLPKSCDNGQVQHLVQKLFDGDFLRREYEIHPKVFEVKALGFRPRFFLKKSFMLLMACVAVAALFGRLAKNLEKVIKVDENNNNIAMGTENEIKLSSTGSFIRCFNSTANKAAIRSRESSPSAVNSISGMR